MKRTILTLVLLSILSACGRAPREVVVHPNTDMEAVLDGVDLLEEAAGCPLFRVRASNGKGPNWRGDWPRRGVVTIEVDPDKVLEEFSVSPLGGQVTGFTAYRLHVAKARVYLAEAKPWVIAHELGSHVLGLGHSEDCASVFGGRPYCLRGHKFTDEDKKALQDMCL